MHHTFYATGKTSCGRSLTSVNKKYTGLDSLVSCVNCRIELAKYREFFPLASNEVDFETQKPLMVGGAR